MAMRRREREPAYREEDKTFLLSSPLTPAHGVRQTKEWLLNVESVHDHADVLVKKYIFSLLQLLPISFFSGRK